ncbi:hypothetical protein [Caballeronia sp. 15711]|uniref:hypothetical protein n=1 Tax=Caballeronia sp. 15711 TaxID=3391029 RepID=UPI0039E665F1
MSEGQPTERETDAFMRFMKLLPHGKDIELVVLKAHLLIEEQIHLIVRNRLQNPDVLGRLNCGQAIKLAQAFYPPEHEPETWKAVKQLNSLRNDIAHQLQSDQLKDKMQALVRSFPSGFANIAEDDQDNFELTMWSLFVAVSSLAEHGHES